MQTVRSSQLADVLTPEARLALALLNRARLDAQRGSIEAATWLITCGLTLAEAVAPGGADNALTRFIESVHRDVTAGKIKPQYPAIDSDYYRRRLDG